MALLNEALQPQIVKAMKDRDEVRLNTLRSIKMAFDKYVKDQRKPLDEQAEHKILETLAKQREESLAFFKEAQRSTLAFKEETELAIIRSFLPEDATEAEIDVAVANALTETGATTIKQMALVLKSVRTLLAGKRVDGAMLASKVKAHLA
jgi:uncharacterized protein YqeY